MTHDVPDDSHPLVPSSRGGEERQRTRERLRRLPSVAWLCQRANSSQTDGQHDQERDPRLTRFAREILDDARREIRRGETPPSREDLVAAIRERMREAQEPYLREVINATGVIIHTNLGRAP